MTRIHAIVAGLILAAGALFLLGTGGGRPAPASATQPSYACAYNSDCGRHRFCVNRQCLAFQCREDRDCGLYGGGHCETHAYDAAADHIGPQVPLSPAVLDAGAYRSICVPDGATYDSLMAARSVVVSPDGTTSGAVTVGAVAAPQPTIEFDTDRPGNDYVSRPLGDGDDQRACEALCRADGNCRAFTFVKGGVQGPHPVCYLKNAIPPAKHDACCVTGVIRP